MLAAELQRKRLGLAIFRDEADADIGAHRLGWRSDYDRLAVDAQMPGGEVSHPETGEEEVELAHALQAGDAKDFAGAQAERSLAQLAGCRNALDCKHLGSQLAPPFARREGMRKRAARDHADNFVIGVGGDGASGDVPTVAQDRHRIAKGPHLPEAVGDEHGRYAAGAQAPDDPAEPVDVASRQRRRRFVEEENARATEQGAGDLDLLL